MADPLLKKRRVSKVEPTAAAQDHNYVAPAYAQPLRIPQIKNKVRRGNNNTHPNDMQTWR